MASLQTPEEQKKPFQPGFVPAGLEKSLTSPTSTNPGHQHFKEVTLIDGATVALDVRLGNIFILTALGDRTLLVPTNPKTNYRIIIKHKASGGGRTLTLTTGSAGAFRFGTTISGLSATTSGLTDYIECLYNAADDRWDVVDYIKGF